MPLAPLKWDEIEVEICTRLFAISLDKVGAPADYMAKSERANFITEKYGWDRVRGRLLPRRSRLSQVNSGFRPGMATRFSGSTGTGKSGRFRLKTSGFLRFRFFPFQPWILRLFRLKSSDFYRFRFLPIKPEIFRLFWLKSSYFFRLRYFPVQPGILRLFRL